MRIYLKISYVRLISAFTIMVADNMARKPSKTDTSFHFVASFASALAGSTIKSPIQTIIPTAIKKVIVCILLTIFCTSVIKSDPGSVTSRSGLDFACMTFSGLQFLKFSRGFPVYLQFAALTKIGTVQKKSIQIMEIIFFINILKCKMCNKSYNKISEWYECKSYDDISERFHSSSYFFCISRSPQELSSYPYNIDDCYDAY